MHLPELSLLPPDRPPPPLCCCRCCRQVLQALDLPYGIVCHPCLQSCSLDELAAIVCAAIVQLPD